MSCTVGSFASLHRLSVVCFELIRDFDVVCLSVLQDPEEQMKTIKII